MFGYASFGFLFLIAFLASLSSSTQNLLTSTKFVLTWQLTPKITHTPPISKPFCPLFLPRVPLYPPDSIEPSQVGTAEMYSGFFYAGEMSCRKSVVTRDCIVFAVNDTISQCPEEKESLIWYGIASILWRNVWLSFFFFNVWLVVDKMYI